ncbi:MAG: hypothetical protein DRJ40_11685 [Thermoprotei archaeon]|nr:MAG: hypothetical protein DRJ40_11685 [Thermoprotei archaeon]
MERVQVPQLPPARTYIEAIFLYFVNGIVTGQLRYPEAVKELSFIVEEEIEAERLRYPIIYEKFIKYLEQLFVREFGREVPDLPNLREGNPRTVLTEYLRSRSHLIVKRIARGRRPTESEIDREIDFIVSRMIVYAGKALFKELGYLR